MHGWSMLATDAYSQPEEFQYANPNQSVDVFEPPVAAKRKGSWQDTVPGEDFANWQKRQKLESNQVAENSLPHQQEQLQQQQCAAMQDSDMDMCATNGVHEEKPATNGMEVSMSNSEPTEQASFAAHNGSFPTHQASPTQSNGIINTNGSACHHNPSSQENAPGKFICYRCIEGESNQRLMQPQHSYSVFH